MSQVPANILAPWEVCISWVTGSLTELWGFLWKLGCLGMVPNAAADYSLATRLLRKSHSVLHPHI